MTERIVDGIWTDDKHLTTEEESEETENESEDECEHQRDDVPRL